jgi:hypothetical protein
MVKPLPRPLAKVIRSRGEAVSLDAPEMVSRPAPAGLDLVGDEEDPYSSRTGFIARDRPVGPKHPHPVQLRDHAATSPMSSLMTS